MALTDKLKKEDINWTALTVVIWKIVVVYMCIIYTNMHNMQTKMIHMYTTIVFPWKYKYWSSRGGWVVKAAAL